MERLEQGGVPVIWREGPQDAMAVLMFRTGIADEAPHARGTSHLLEHLTLHGLGRRDFPINGFVDPLVTAFWARGRQDEIVSFLHDVADRLAEPRLERLEAELQVLRTEAAADQGDFISRMMMLRFGARGFGTTLLQELGLRDLQPEDVLRWRDEHYSAGNAVVWMHSPEPPDLALALRPGDRVAPPPAEALPGLRFPAWVQSGTGGVAVSMIAPRGWGMPAAMWTVAERLQQKLRDEAGLVYSVDGAGVPLSADRSHQSIGADCLDRNALEVTRVILDVLEAVASEGPTEQELDDMRRRAERQFEDDDRDWTRGALDFAASEELLGGSVLTPEQMLEHQRAVTPEQARAALAEAFESRLVIVTDDCPKPHPDLDDLERPERPIDGRVYKVKGRRQPVELKLGEAGVRLTDEQGGVINIPADEVAFVVRRASGILQVNGLDSSWVELDPANLREGDEAVAAVEALAGGAGAVIPDGDEVTPVVTEVAEAKLKKTGPVSGELELLPGALQDGERPLTMAQAARGLRSGLVVLTDRRLLFLYKGARKEEIVEYRRSDLRAADVKSGLFDTKLLVGAPDQWLEFNAVAPKERAVEIAEAIEGDPL